LRTRRQYPSGDSQDQPGLSNNFHAPFYSTWQGMCQ
jgi:hypothetical protein